LEPLTLFITALMVGFSGALVPGPLLTITIDRSIKHGAKAGPLVVLGHAGLELITVVGIFFGLGFVLQQSAVARTIGIVGGLVLLWMGYGMVQSWKKAAFTYEEVAAGSEFNAYTGLVVAGVVGSVSNPYWFLWWATVGAAFIVQSFKIGALGVTIFFFGHILADFLWYSAVSIALTAGRKVFNDVIYRWVLLFCGLFMIFLAFYFIWSGLTGNINVEGL